MHIKTIFAKTASGTAELDSRQLKLSPHSRTVLIAVDGHRDVGELEQMFIAYGAKLRQILAELQQLALIQDIAASTLASKASATADTQDAELPDLITVRKRINELAADAAGLRAFLFTLKLERCYSVAELRAIMDGFHALLNKAKGANYANEQTERIHRVLDRLEAATPPNP